MTHAYFVGLALVPPDAAAPAADGPDAVGVVRTFTLERPSDDAESRGRLCEWLAEPGKGLEHWNYGTLVPVQKRQFVYAMTARVIGLDTEPPSAGSFFKNSPPHS